MVSFMISRVLIFVALVIYWQFSFGSISEFEKGEVIGGVGFSAITLDRYYAVCFSNGYNSQNNLKGVDRMSKMKFGITFSEMAKKLMLTTGRDYFQEASDLVEDVKAKLGGCKSEKMKKWLYLFRLEHDKALKKFHDFK